MGTTELESLSDSLILNILNYCTPFEVGKIGQCSQRLAQIAEDDVLWRRLFHRYFHLEISLTYPLGKNATWKEEFIRLIDQVPFVETQILTDHTDEVLHVSFSHNGQLFVTTSKDSLVNIWNSTSHPVTLHQSINMGEYNLKNTLFSQFNESDTLLLVTGVLFGFQGTGGEITIFFTGPNGKFDCQCRMTIKPYDVFGCWYSDTYFFSGDLVWLEGQYTSKSTVWICNALHSQQLQTPEEGDSDSTSESDHNSESDSELNYSQTPEQEDVMTTQSESELNIYRHLSMEK